MIQIVLNQCETLKIVIFHYAFESNAHMPQRYHSINADFVMTLLFFFSGFTYLLTYYCALT